MNISLKLASNDFWLSVTKDTGLKLNFLFTVNF